METSAETDPFRSLYPLMEAKGVTTSAEDFHRAVNLTFHDVEARHYDELHRSMWESLPRQFELLTRDLEADGRGPTGGLTLLDVGCGTGLSSELLLRTPLGRRVTRVHLLDTSPEMLERSRWRAAGWGVPHRVVEGTIADVPDSAAYDLVLVCSVLHHIPDLPAFLRRVGALERPGGAFLHLQDPNGEHARDEGLARRKAELQRARFLQRLGAKARRLLRSDAAYIGDVNRRLLEAGVIREPMTAGEIWSVTDIHVVDLPYSMGDGISTARLAEALPDYDLVSRRSYGFFGQLASELPPAFREREQALVDARALDGEWVSGAWRRTR